MKGNKLRAAGQRSVSVTRKTDSATRNASKARAVSMKPSVGNCPGPRGAAPQTSSGASCVAMLRKARHPNATGIGPMRDGSMVGKASARTSSAPKINPSPLMLATVFPPRMAAATTSTPRATLT